MRLEHPGQPLQLRELPLPICGPDELLLRVTACGVCRTDLHMIDGELVPYRLPIVPGHEVVGIVAQAGNQVRGFATGERVGVPWLAGTCGHCSYCAQSRENLCDAPRFTGYDRDGGYAQFMTADARYCLQVPDGIDDAHLAPLLCAGLIGYRAYIMAGPARRIGLYGFGAAAHILVQIARWQGQEVFAFTRPGDLRTQAFARTLGAVWAGDAGSVPGAPDLSGVPSTPSTPSTPSAPLDAAIIFASAGELVPAALAAVRKGGTVVCAGIHMSDIPAFPYALLWGERTLRSVANLTREDGAQFMDLIRRCPLVTHPVTFALEDANAAVAALRRGEIEGAAVLLP